LFCTLWDFEDENEDEDEDEPTRGHPLFCILYPPRPMTLLPIAERELRVASRRRGTYWLRSMLGLSMVVLWFFMLVVGQRSMSTLAVSQMLFTTTGILALGFCLLAGVFLTADCLSEEKREGTLGLLFLTELKGYDVVLGKLMATSLHAFYGVLTVLPLLSLPLLLGGVTAGEFWRVSLVLIVTLLLSLSLGLFVSAFSRETRQATSTTLMLVILLTGVLPALYALRVWLLGHGGWNALLWVSPGFLFGRAYESYYRFRGAPEFWGSLSVLLLLAVMALVLACVYLPRAWREKGESGTARQPAGWRWSMRFGNTKVRARRRRLLEDNPFYWLASRDRQPSWLAWGFLGTLFPIWSCFLGGSFVNSMRTKTTCFTLSLFMGFALHLVFKYLLAVEASRRLSDDRYSGALELLLVSPLSTGQILAGQLRALRNTFAGPALLVLLVNIGLAWSLYAPSAAVSGSDDRWIFSELCLGGALVLLVDALALAWVGMWMGLRARRHHRAILATLGRILLPPWLIMFCYMFSHMGGGMGSGELAVTFGLWYLLSLALDLILLATAREGLLNNLRESAVPARHLVTGLQHPPSAMQHPSSFLLSR
jgi:ABC-type multidrug transport system permease subunit